MLYMISYDLHAPTNNREKVEESIKGLGTWCKYVSTTYIVKSSSDLETVKNAAIKFLDPEDRMIVVSIEKPIRGWLSDKQWDWIREKL